MRLSTTRSAPRPVLVRIATGLAVGLAVWPAVAAADPTEADAAPYVAQVPADSEAPRALLLKSARLATDAPGAAEALAAALPAGLRGAPVAAGGLLVVQFAPSVPDAERLAILARHGAAAGDYVPNHARLARVPAPSVAALAAEPGVAWIGRLHPALKLAPELGLGAAGGPWHLRLAPAPGISLDELATDARAAGARVLGVADNSIEVEVEVEAENGVLARLARLARLESVLAVHEVPVLAWQNRDSRWVCQSFVPNSDSVHARGLRGANQLVTIMDSGLDTKHCCFSSAGKIADNRAWGGGVLGAGCFGEHGTHTAGTAVCGGGQVNDGLAPDARIVFQDVGTAADCARVFPPSPLSSAWDDARARGSFVHSNSWGGGSNSYWTEAQNLDQYMWNQQDFLLIYSAGNEGPGPGSLGSYSNAKNSITVGGSMNGTSAETMYFFSSRGPAGDGRMLPDLTAPGQTVNSALNASTPSCGWIGFEGTSMAAPAVAGSAALVREYYQRGFYPGGTAAPADGFTPSAALVKATLLVSTRDMTNAGNHRPNSTQGFGRLTLDDALWFGDEPATSRLKVLDDRNTATGFTTTGQEATFELDVLQSGPLKLVLAWTDYPGALLAAKELVNDLDLRVTLADGSTYTGNQGFDQGWTSATSTANDRRNNKEAVFLQSVAPQRVTVKVGAAAINNVTGHPQDYALVVVGPVAGPCGEPLPAGVGNTVRHDRSGANLLASWADRGADHYVVYRGTTPNFMSGSPPPYRDDVVDEDPGQTGIQWTDAGALLGPANYFYLYSSANSCGQEAP